MLTSFCLCGMWDRKSSTWHLCNIYYYLLSIVVVHTLGALSSTQGDPSLLRPFARPQIIFGFVVLPPVYIL